MCVMIPPFAKALGGRPRLALLLIVELADTISLIWSHDLVKLENAPFGAFFNLMGRVTRFELATFGTTNRRSNQLSYTRHKGLHIFVCLSRLCTSKDGLVELIRLELTSAFACHQVSQPFPCLQITTYRTIC